MIMQLFLQFPGIVLHLTFFVSRSRPEKPSESVTAIPGHDVHVQVRYGLANYVVYRDETSLRVEGMCLCHGNALSKRQQRHHQCARKIKHRVHVLHRRYQHVALEHWTMIKKSDEVLVSVDDCSVKITRDDLAHDVDDHTNHSTFNRCPMTLGSIG